MGWTDTVEEGIEKATGRDWSKSHDLYCNYEKVDALIENLNNIKENDVETARKNTQDAIDALNKIKGFSECVGQLSSCDETYDYINQLIDTISTTVNSIASDIKTYEEAMDSGEWIGGTLWTSWMSLGEGTYKVGEWIGDGIASIGGWICIGVGDEETAGKIADWIEEDHAAKHFDAVWDTDLAKKSTFTRDSTLAGAWKTVGEISTIMTAGQVLTPVAEATVGKTVTVLGGKVTLTANTIADSTVAYFTGYGSGFEKSLKNTSGTGDSTKSRYLKATGTGTWEGTKDAGISLVVGGAGDTFAANKAAKLTKGASNVDDEAKVLKAADDGLEWIRGGDEADDLANAADDLAKKPATNASDRLKSIKNTDDAVDDLIQKQSELDKAYKSGNYSDAELGKLEEARDAAKKAVTDLGENADDIINKSSELTKAEDTFNSAEKALNDAYKSGNYSDAELGKLEEARDAAKKAYESAKSGLDSTDDIVKGATESTKPATNAAERLKTIKSTDDAAQTADDILDSADDLSKKPATNAADRLKSIKAEDEAGILGKVKNTVKSGASTAANKVSEVASKAKTTITTAGKTALEAAGKTPRTSSAISATAVAVNNNNNSSDTQFKSNIDSKTVPVSKTSATGGNENLSSKDIPGDDTTPKDENVDGGGNQSYVPSGNYSPSDTTNNDTGNTESNEQFKEELGTIEDKIEKPKDDTPKDTTPKDTTPKDDTPVDDTPKDTTPKDDTPSDDKVIVTPTPTDTTPIITQNPTDGGGTTTTGGGYSRSGGYTASNTTPTTPVDEIKNSVRDIDEIIGGNNKTYKQIPKSSSVITKKATSGAGSSVIPIAAGLSAAAAAGIGAKAYIDRKKNNDNGEDEDDFDTEEWSEDGNLDIDYSDDSDTKVEENLIDEDNDNYDDSDNYSDDNYAYQEVEEEKYGARNNEELADLQ